VPLASTHQSKSKATTEEERKATLVLYGLNVNVLLEGRAEADVEPPVVVVVVVVCVQGWGSGGRQHNRRDDVLSCVQQVASHLG
jgi:hypothetical protein